MARAAARKAISLKTSHYDGKPNPLPEDNAYNCKPIESGGQGPAY